MRSQPRRPPISGTISADSDYGDSSQCPRRRPFNCAAAFDSSSSSNNPASPSDAYLYSDPEMLVTGWQSGQTKQKSNNTTAAIATFANTVTTVSSCSSASSTVQSSSVTVISAPGGGTSVSGNSMRSYTNDRFNEKTADDSATVSIASPF